MLATSRLASHLLRSVAGLAAILWIGEAISLSLLGAVILGFLGLLLILKPGSWPVLIGGSHRSVISDLRRPRDGVLKHWLLRYPLQRHVERWVP